MNLNKTNEKQFGLLLWQQTKVNLLVFITDYPVIQSQLMYYPRLANININKSQKHETKLKLQAIKNNL